MDSSPSASAEVGSMRDLVDINNEPPWKVATDKDTGRQYWWNTQTREVAKQKPQELTDWEIRIAELQGTETHDASATEFAPADDTHQNQEGSVTKEVQGKDGEKVNDVKKSKKPTATGEKFSFWGRLMGRKLKTAEDLEEENEVPEDPALQHYRIGFHHVKFPTEDPNQFDEYEGEFRRYKFNGKGTFTFADGEKYVGEWQYGKQHGKGKKTWPDGRWYEGQYVDDMRSGKGKMYIPDVMEYDGEWLNNLFHGKGKITWPAESQKKKNRMPGSYSVSVGPDGVQQVSWGLSYEGDFVDGLKHGKGTMKFHDNTVYVGEFVKDVYNGVGKITFSNKDTYEGDWKNGVPHGKGTEIVDDSGETYTGDFEDGHRTGKGMLMVESGWAWKGTFENGSKIGKGTHISPTGEKLYGEWWQHSWARAELSDSVARTVLRTYAVEQGAFVKLFPERVQEQRRTFLGQVVSGVGKVGSTAMTTAVAGAGKVGSGALAGVGQLGKVGSGVGKVGVSAVSGAIKVSTGVVAGAGKAVAASVGDGGSVTKTSLVASNDAAASMKFGRTVSFGKTETQTYVSHEDQ